MKTAAGAKPVPGVGEGAYFQANAIIGVSEGQFFAYKGTIKVSLNCGGMGLEMVEIEAGERTLMLKILSKI
jgi:hypothetical protein